MCIYLQDIKCLWSILLLEQLYTDNTNDDNDDNNDGNNNNNDDNDTWQTNHDCIGSLACMPNDPKSFLKLLLIIFIMNTT